MRRWLQRALDIASVCPREIVLLVALVFAIASLSIPASLVARWVSTAMLILIVSSLWRSYRQLPLANLDFPFKKPLLTALPYLLVTGAAAFVLWPITALEMPVSQDHINHYFSTHVLAYEMIPSGRFFGWTDRIGTGYPFGDLYPTPAYLATTLLHFLSLRSIDLHTSYAFGVLLAWLVPAMGITAWARRLGGNLGAIFAGLAFLVDAGGDREGGWIYAMFHGVWPQQLGMGLWLFALLALWRLSEKMTTRRYCVSVVLAGTCLWMHPMNAITLLMAAIVFFVIRLLGAPNQGDSTRPNRGVIRMVFALIPAALIGLIWISRMMLAQDVVSAYPAFWKPLTELARQMYEGDLFGNQIAFVGLLAIIGAIKSIGAGGRFHLVTVALAAILMLAGSLDFLLATDLGLVGGKMGIMQYSRFSIAIKPLWYALAGGGLSIVITGIAKGSKRATLQPEVPLATRAVFAAVLAPVVWAMISATPSLVKSPVALPLMIEDVQNQDEMGRIADLLEREKARCSQELCRAVYYQDFRRREHGGLYPVRSMADADYGWLPTRRLPANNFMWLNDTRDPDTMARLGANVVISRWELEHQRLELIEKVGRHFVYRLKGVQAQVVVNGPGKAVVTSWEPERKEVTLSQSEPNTSVTFSVPPYGKWHALQDGRPLKIAPQRTGAHTFLKVIGATDGILTLVYTDSALEIVFKVLGGTLLVACLLGMAVKPKTISTAFLSPAQLRRVYAILKGILALLAIVVIVGIVTTSNNVVARQWLTGDLRNKRVLSVLHRDGPLQYRFTPKQACIQPYVRDPGREHNWDCSTANYGPVLDRVPSQSLRLASCLSITVPKHGKAHLTFALPTNTTLVKGRLHLLPNRSGHGKVKPRWSEGISAKAVLGTKSEEIHQRFQITPTKEADTITFDFTSQRLANVCIEAVALE